MNENSIKRDLDTVMQEVNTLLGSLSTGTTPEGLQSAKNKLFELSNEMKARTLHAVKATDHYVHQRPWQAIGFASAIGVLIGVLVARR
jgi:ElaB/YqjD/DUF883 family membrane-anchored ribosome-binding protein